MDAVLAHLDESDAAWVQTLTSGEIAQVLSHGAQLIRLVGPPVDKIRLMEQKKPPKMNAAELGAVGEDYFEKVVSALSPRYTIKNMAKQGKKGDFIIEWDEVGSHRALIDIKNYATSVPTKEVEKLRRDIECNRSVTAGMMISLKSKITGYSSFAIETLIVHGKKVPMVMISTDNPRLIVEYVQFMFYMAETNRRCLNVDGVDLSKHHIQTISVQMDTISHLGNSLAVLKGEMNKSLDRAILDMTICENRIRDTLGELVNVMDEKSELEQSGHVSFEEVVSGIAKISPPDDLEVLQKIWGGWETSIKKGILVMTKEGTSIRVKFLKTRINATVLTGGSEVALRLDIAAIPVLKALGIL